MVNRDAAHFNRRFVIALLVFSISRFRSRSSPSSPVSPGLYGTDGLRVMEVMTAKLSYVRLSLGKVIREDQIKFGCR